MRKILFALCASLLFGSTALAQQNEKQTTFTIKGSIPTSLKIDTLTLSYYDPEHKHWAQMPVKNGKFEATLPLNRIQQAYLYDNSHELTMKEFYLEPGYDVTVSATGTTWQSVIVKSGPIQADWLLFEKQRAPLMAKIEAVKKQFDLRTNEGFAAATKATEPMYKEMALEQNKFIAMHPASYVSYDMVLNRTMIVENPDEDEPIFNLLDKKWKESKSGQAIAGRLAAARKNAIGKIATDFASVDTLGNAFSLASLRGKYVLVDFWASWCGFCRAQTPTLKKVYAKYRDKNFTIVSVSYDDNKQAWMKAIHEDKMPWQQISELKGVPDAPSAKDYGITAIPQNVLLNPEGRIIAKNINVTKFDQEIGRALGVN